MAYEARFLPAMQEGSVMYFCILKDELFDYSLVCLLGFSPSSLFSLHLYTTSPIVQVCISRVVVSFVLDMQSCIKF